MGCIITKSLCTHCRFFQSWPASRLSCGNLDLCSLGYHAKMESTHQLFMKYGLSFYCIALKIFLYYLISNYVNEFAISNNMLQIMLHYRYFTGPVLMLSFIKSYEAVKIWKTWLTLYKFYDLKLTWVKDINCLQIFFCLITCFETNQLLQLNKTWKSAMLVLKVWLLLELAHWILVFSSYRNLSIPIWWEHLS